MLFFLSFEGFKNFWVKLRERCCFFCLSLEEKMSFFHEWKSESFFQGWKAGVFLVVLVLSFFV